MSSENLEVFTKENLDLYFRELSREYKRLGGRKIPVEIVLVGSAAIVEHYGFREMTTDVDAILPAVSIMKDAINHVGDRYGLPNGWLNADFTKTDSYSHRIMEYSKPYRTFYQVLHVRIVTGEYLIAMKLRSGRKYKNDLSDVVGILAEHEQMGSPISYAQIDTAVQNLYGGWGEFPEDAVSFLQAVLQEGSFTEAYHKIRMGEIQAKETLLQFQEDYPGVMNAENVNDILNAKTQKAYVLEQLRQLKSQKDSTPSQTSQQPSEGHKYDRESR